MLHLPSIKAESTTERPKEPNKRKKADKKKEPRIEMVVPVEVDNSCLTCYEHHKKCDKTRPACGNCVSRGWDCIWRDEPLTATPATPATRQLAALTFNTPSQAQTTTVILPASQIPAKRAQPDPEDQDDDVVIVGESEWTTHPWSSSHEVVPLHSQEITLTSI
jgi:hypothetical protein